VGIVCEGNVISKFDEPLENPDGTIESNEGIVVAVDPEYQKTNGEEIKYGFSGISNKAEIGDTIVEVVGQTDENFITRVFNGSTNALIHESILPKEISIEFDS